MNTRRKMAILAGLTMPLLAAIYLFLGIHSMWDVPRDPDHKAAAEIVLTGWQDGDTIVFAPDWAQEAAPHFRGKPTHGYELVDWYEVSKNPRVWVVASPWGRAPVPPEGFRVVSASPAGRMTVHLWESTQAALLAYDFRKGIPDAKVSRIKDESRQECNVFHEGRWHCGGVHPWLYVGPLPRDTGGSVRDVIWAHALENEQVLDIRYPDLPSAGRLVVHFGLSQRAIEQDTGAPVSFRVLAGDEVLAERTLGISEGGWFRLDRDLAGIDTSEIVFQIQTRHARDRQFCFTADLWN